MRIIVENAWTMLLAKKFPACLWTEAVNIAVYVQNSIFPIEINDIVRSMDW